MVVSNLGMASSLLSSLDRWDRAGTAHQRGGGNRVRIGERWTYPRKKLNGKNPRVIIYYGR